MGILRTDRVTGLGGANAIKGSTKFDGDLNYQGNYLSTEDSDDFNLGSGDFTIEAWIFTSATSTFEGIIGQWPASGASANNSWVLEVVGGDLEFYYCHSGATLVGPIQGGSISTNKWTHVMATRSGNTMYMFINGTAHNNSGQSVTHTFNDSTYDVTIGGYVATAAMWNGNISNVRVIKGTALHTSNFTVPTNELVTTSDTVLLACQSSANVSQEATGKIITPRRTNINSSYPSATKFTPNSPVGFSTTTDVGSQYGSTFDGFGSFATSTYMVPPGGNTRERNRGRGLSMGGATPGISNVISFIEMSSYGQTGDFGDLTHVVNGSPGACSSSTRGIVGGGQSPSSNLNTINFVTIANTANALDFGDLSVARRGIAACANNTRGLWGGGRSDPSGSNPTDEIDFVTIATLGNASDFGNLSVARRYLGSTSSTTRGFWMGGNSPSASDVIDFITITSTGNAADFGNLTAGRSSCEGCSSATRAIVIGGFISPAYVNTIDYFTMASSGNATDFGDSTTVSGDSSPCSNSIRGYRVGGGNDSTQMNSIDFVTIATTGNAQDFGDLPVVQSEGGGCSDSHGGLE